MLFGAGAHADKPATRIKALTCFIRGMVAHVSA